MNAARAFMRREDYQPNQPRNPAVSQPFNLSCVKCGSADVKIIGEYNAEGGELAERFKQDAPLNQPDQSTFYGSGAKVYTDYPFLKG